MSKKIALVGSRLAANEREVAFDLRSPLLRLGRQSLAVTLSLLLFLQPAIANAQSVSAAGSAPAANQPSVGAAPNGVPLIDIVTPNGTGLSHNKYDNFNVGTPGLILNNFNGEVGTSNLGGATPGNPNLRNSGPASVILNEVTSGNRSALNGPTEVFGGRADVIIANPNGITCAGCGFINTPRATLTSGVPNIGADGSLSGFTVNGGDVTFEGAGGNFAAAPGAVDLFDVVARNIHVNAPVYGKTIRLTGGASQYNYATGEATALTATSGTPEYAIDGTALGAMQADRIKVVVTEKGAGVKMSGDMAANAGELTLSADGKISIGNASGRDGVAITSKQKATAAKVTSRQKVSVQADQGITLQSVAADSDIVLANGTGLLSASGDVNSGTSVQLSSDGGIAAGSVTAGNGAATLVATSGDIAIGGAASSTGDLTLTATAGSISAASLLSYNNLALTAGNSLAVSGNVLAQGNVSATAQSISTGMVVSGINIAATSADPGGNVVLGSAGNLSLTATRGTIATGNLQSAGSLNTGATGNITAGNIQSAGNLTATATSLTAANVTSHGGLTVNAAINASGQILGAGDILISGAGIEATAIAAGVDFASTNAAGGNIVLGSAGALDLKAAAGTIAVGTLLSAGDLTAHAALLQANNITSHGAVGVAGGVNVANQLLGAGNITINGNANGVSADLLASGVDFAATKANGGDIVLSAGGGDLTINDSAGAIQAGTVLAAGAINTTGQTITADTITGHKDIVLSGATSAAAGSGSVDIIGQVLGGGNVRVSGSGIQADAIVSGVDIAATNAAGGSVVLGAPSAGTGNLTLTATGALSAGTLLSAGNLTAGAATVTAGNISAHGNMLLGGAISVTDQILASGNVSISGQSLKARTIVSGIDFDATNAASGNIVLGHAGNLTVNVNGAIAAPTIQAAGAIDVSGASITADAITGHEDISLSGTAAGGVATTTASGRVDIANQLLGGGNLGISGSSIKVGTAVSGVDFAATAAANGSIVQTTSGNLTLAAAGNIDTGTLLSAGSLNAAGSTITAGSVTAHGDVTLRGATSVTGQILGASNVLITGQSLAAQTVVAGVDFGATNAAGGNIVVGQTATIAGNRAGDLTAQLSGGFSASTMQAAGAINVNAATVTTDAVTGHKDITFAGATTVNQQMLSGGNIGISGSSIKAGAIVSGVDFAATAAANGNIVQTTSGNLTLASTGAIKTGTLLSAGTFSASGTTVSADAVTAHGDATLNGVTSITGQILAAGNVLITGQGLSAQSVVAGIDFAATDASGGNIVLGQTGNLAARLSGGFSASTVEAAGTININAASVTAATITGH
ncbi:MULTISPECIES: filamentous hemagglutinin N-terminal domain-containing protein, partial [unclassified Rhizobium]